MEVVVEEEQKETPQLNQNNIASIDLGVDNFVTLTNNIGLNPIIINGRIIKSINQFYNKRRAELQSKLPKDVFWSKQLDSITFKRFNRIKNFIHHTSKFIVGYCVKNNIHLLPRIEKRKTVETGRQLCYNTIRKSAGLISGPYCDI